MPGGFFNPVNPTTPAWANWAKPLPQTLGQPAPTGIAPGTATPPPPAAPPAPAPLPAPVPAAAPPTAAPAATQGAPPPLTPDTLSAAHAAWLAAGSPGGPMGFMGWYNSGGYQPPAGGGGAPGGGTPPPGFPDALGGLLGTMFPGSTAPASPFTPEMMNFLPGRSAGGEAAQSLLLNTLLNQFLQQGPRSQQAEDIYGGVFNAGVNSPAYGLSQDAASMARGRIQPGALDAYESQLRTQAASDAGQGYQSSMQRLRDAGMSGRGAMGVDPTLAASNLANQGLQRANTDISGIMESLTQNRLGQAGDLSRSGADVFQNLGMAPAYNYANRLSTQKNAALSPFLEQLNMLSQMAITGDVATRNQPSAFESIGVPIIGGALSGASGIGDLLKAFK